MKTVHISKLEIYVIVDRGGAILGRKTVTIIVIYAVDKEMLYEIKIYVLLDFGEYLPLFYLVYCDELLN